MFSGQPAFPSATGVNTSSSGFVINTNIGLTVEQLMAMVAMHALMSNPNYTPNTYQEMAQKSKEIAQALLIALQENVMPAILEKLKDKLMAKGMPKSNAFAVATSALQKQGKMKPGSQQLTAKGKAAK